MAKKKSNKKEKIGTVIKHSKPIRRMNMTILRVCENCRKPLGNVNVGLAHRIFRCKKCETVHLTEARPERCVSCKAMPHHLTFVAHLSVRTQISTGYCEDCERIYGEMDKIVREGGVYWKCSSCHSRGAWKKEHEVATRLREQGLDVASLEINRKNCPVCSPEAIKQRVEQEKKRLDELRAEAKKRSKAKPPTKKKTVKKKVAKRKKTVKKRPTKKPPAPAPEQPSAGQS